MICFSQNQPTSPRATPQNSLTSALSPPNISPYNTAQGRSSAPLVTPNTPSDSYSSLGYQFGRSSVPLMNQDAYYSDTNTNTSTSTSSYNHGRLSAPIVSPTSTAGTGTVPNTPAQESLTLSGLEGDVQLAFSQPSGSSSMNMKNLRNDLLSAADSITGAMSSLVKELNSGTILD